MKGLIPADTNFLFTTAPRVHRPMRRWHNSAVGAALAYKLRREGYEIDEGIVLSSDCQVMFDTLTVSLPHLRSARFEYWRLREKARLKALPAVPAASKTLPRYDAGAWGGIAAPRGTPPEIIAKLNAEINVGLTHARLKAQLADVAGPPMLLGPVELGALMAAETEKWAKVIRVANIRPE